MTEVENDIGRFPCKLEQPEGSFRFSGDSLVLSDAASRLAVPEYAFVCDIGTGCGVAALALLLKKPLWSAVGLEKEAELASAAERNAAMLGLEGRFSVVQGDAADETAIRRLRDRLGHFTGEEKGKYPLFDAVICNPPWKKAGEGRLPPEPLRRAALFGDSDTYSVFFKAADKLLRQRGMLVAVAGAGRTADMLAALPPRLNPEELLFWFSHPEEAEWVVLVARKNGKAQLKVKMKMM